MPPPCRHAIDATPIFFFMPPYYAADAAGAAIDYRQKADAADTHGYAATL